MVKKTDKLNSFFIKSNKKATCQIKKPVETGAICGQVFSTPDSSTTSTRSHVKSQHPEAYMEMIQFEADFAQKKDEEDKKLERLYNQVEKRTPKKRDQPDHPSSASASENSDTSTVGTPGKIIFAFLFSNVSEYLLEYIRFLLVFSNVSEYIILNLLYLI